LRRCHNHDFDDLTQIHIFRNGLQHQPKLFLDVAAGGSLMSKSVEDALTIIERMALSDHQGQYSSGSSQRKAGIIQLSATNAMLAQNKLLAQSVEELKNQLSKLPQQLKEILEVPSKPKHVAYCELCSGDHPTGYCLPSNEEVNYMGNHQKNTDAAIENIKTQLDQMANMQGGTFTANTETNPKEHYKSISTRSDEVIGKGIGDNLETERVVVELNEKQEGEKEESEKETEVKSKEGELVENEKNERSEKEENGEIFENNVEKLFGEEATSMNNPYKIKLPYPHAPTKKIAIEEKVIEENEELKKVVVGEKDQNEGEEEEKLVEKEEENNNERDVNKAEIDKVIESICALFNQNQLRRTCTPHHLYFKFMEFLPNQRKQKNDVVSVSFWPP
jgi:hypothetical protein